MKKVVILLSIVFLSATVFAQEMSIKIGYVDSQVILNQYPPAVKAQSDLDAMVQKWYQQIDSMNVELNQEVQEYQQQAATMTEDARAAREQELVKKQQATEQFRQAKFNQQNGELYRKQEEFLGPIKEKVFDAIDKVAQVEGMKFVFDKAGDVVLLYASEEYDITYKVLDQLKRGK